MNKLAVKIILGLFNNTEIMELISIRLKGFITIDKRLFLKEHQLIDEFMENNTEGN